MKTVLIDSDGKVFNEDKVVKVSKNGNEDVRWVAMENGGPWTITFDKVTPPGAYPVAAGSPFTKTFYTAKNGASGGSTGGPVAGLVGWTYMYQVRAGDGDINGPVKDDPDIDIES